MNRNGEHDANGKVGAKSYARQPYLVQVDEDAIGGSPGFTASHPEMRGCRGQGRTREEAVADLALARELYIQSLLDDGLPVPKPQGQAAAATAPHEHESLAAA